MVVVVVVVVVLVVEGDGAGSSGNNGYISDHSNAVSGVGNGGRNHS
jgi:preprotein translocase subunit SecG